MSYPRVLVVEDDPHSLDLINQFLSESYEVLPAEDGDSALELLAAETTDNNPPIEAIVLDLIMPGMSGLDLLQILKNDPRFNHIPIIIQTAISDRDEVSQALKSGAYQYLTKPYDDKVLLAMVDSAIEVCNKMKSEKESIREYQKSTTYFFRKQLLDLKVLEVLNEFSLESFSEECQTPIDLVQLVVKALKKFEFPSASAKEAALDGEKEILRCSILVRKGSDNELGFSDRGYEEKLSLADRYLLSQAVDQGAILTKNNYTAIPSASGRVAFLIRNSPTEFKEQERALKIITNIIEYFEKRLEHFENQYQIRKQKDDLEHSYEQTKEVIQSSLQEFEGVNTKYQAVKEQQMDIWENLLEKIGADSPFLNDVSTAMNEALQLYSEDHLTDQHFLEIMKELGEIFGRKQPESAEAFADQLGGISQDDVDSLLASLQK